MVSHGGIEPTVLSVKSSGPGPLDECDIKIHWALITETPPSIKGLAL